MAVREYAQQAVGKAKKFIKAKLRAMLIPVIGIALALAIMIALISAIVSAISGASDTGSSSSMSSAASGDYNVYTASPQSAPVINDIDTLKQAFSGYATNRKLLAEAQTFLDMQNTYKVNAIFCAAVAIQETTAGTNGTYATDGHNWFNYMPITGINLLEGYQGTQSSWCKWDTDAHGIMGFGYYISKHTSCYFSQGEYTVSEIGSHYCVPPDNWIVSVNQYMTDMYSAAGINVYGGTYTAGDSRSYVYGTYSSNSRKNFYNNKSKWNLRWKNNIS